MTLTLGGIQFEDFELPERIGQGGRQSLAIHKAIGGRRIIDAMGPDDAAVSWSGRFMGETAQLRALRLDMLRRSGRKVELAYGLRLFSVVIAEFTADIERPYLVSYSITCEIERDLVAGDGGAESDTAESQIIADLAAAEAAVAAREATLKAVSFASTAVRAAMGDKSARRGLVFIGQAAAEVAVGDAMLAAGADAAAANTAIAAVQGVGGVIQGGDPAQMAASFLGTTVSVEAAYSAQTAAAAMGRVKTGLSILPR